MNPILMRLAAIAVAAGVTLTGCSGGGGSDPRMPGERCGADNVGQVIWRDSHRWQCMRFWNGSRYNYDWSDTTPTLSSVQQLPPKYIAVLDGSAVTIKNGAGEITWKYSVGGGANPPAVELRVSSTGAVTLDPASFTTPQQVQCFGAEGMDCLGLTLRGTGPERPVTVDPATGVLEADLGIVVDVVAIQGFAGLGGNCKLGPITGRLTSRDYDSTAGKATLETAGRPLAAATTCGDQNDLFNGALGLPGTVDVRFLTQVKLS
jgi:hypothetical protein